MPEDRGPGSPATDPTLTPTEAIGVAQTSASLTGPAVPSTGLLPNRYALGAQLGAGGMGEVLLAIDQQIDRDVAIKRMRIAPTAGAVARFVREAKIQGRLDHPAIVPVHELATDAEGRPFFVMKRLTGTTLADLLTSATPPPRQKLLRAFADVCLAIEFAHSRGIIHRDLKPANIMLGDFGEVYVLDWGVARIIAEPEMERASEGWRAGTDDVEHPRPAVSSDGTTQAGDILGTPGYIAPELLRGEPLDGRADVYALGCILFEILSGQSLLPRGREALDAALGEVNARPSQRTIEPHSPAFAGSLHFGREVPPELDEACVAATIQDRNQRPSARQLAERIERYLDGDRDVALRKSLAATHLQAARDALAMGDGETERAEAMREAGRAIALDPREPAAAQLVGRLMLEPPRVVPREVDDKVSALEEDTARRKARLMTVVGVSLMLFVPTSLWMGIRSYTALGVLTATLLVNWGVTAMMGFQRRKPSARDMYMAAAAFGLLLAMLSRFFSPFLLAPAMGTAALMMFVIDPRLRWLPVAVGYTIAVLGPWVLELAGVVSGTTFAVGGDLLLRSELISIEMPHVQLGLALYVVTLFILMAFVAGRTGATQREAVRTLELQAWHLRQLVRG